MITIPRIPILKQNTGLESQIEITFYDARKLYDSIDLGNKQKICADALSVIQSAMGIVLNLSESKLDIAKYLLRHELKIKEKEACREENILGWINLVEKEY